MNNVKMYTAVMTNKSDGRREVHTEATLELVMSYCLRYYSNWTIDYVIKGTILTPKNV